MEDHLITIAIHTLPAANTLKETLEAEGLEVFLQDVDLKNPSVAPGVRVRIHEKDLAKALLVIENPDIFSHPQQRLADDCPRIMVPIDFSPFAMRSCHAAFWLAAKHRAKVEIVYALQRRKSHDLAPLDTKLDFTKMVETVDELLLNDNAELVMEHFAAHLKLSIKNGLIPPAPFATHICEGLPEDVINAQAKVFRPMLIVMGTSGKGQRDSDYMGSVTAEVLDTCRYPIFTIPNVVSDHGFHDLTSIVYFAKPDHHDILALDLLHRMLPDFKLRVTLALLSHYAQPSDHDEVQKLKAYCETHFDGYTFDTQVFTRKDVLAMSNAIKDDTHLYDLFCMPNRRRNAIARFFNPTLVHRMLFHTDVPIFAIPV